MATNDELLNKATGAFSTADISNANTPTDNLTIAASGGKLKPRQANRFLDYLYEQSVLIKDARFVRMNNPTIEIDRIAVGTRILKKATESTDDGTLQKPSFSKIAMTTVKLRLDWEMSTESLEDNIEGASLEDHLASLMARQTANDLEDLFLHGDTTSGDALLKALNGWRLLARTNGFVVDAASANLTRSTFDKALRKLPNKYLQRRADLRWYTSSTLLQDYLWSLTLDVGATGASSPGSVFGDAIVNNGFSGATGGNGNALAGVRPFGIGLLEVPLMEEDESFGSPATTDHGVLELTFPNNRIVGVQRDITVYREYKPKKDVLEFTMFMRVANQIEDEKAIVHTKAIKKRA